VRGAGEGAAGFGSQPGRKQGSFPPQHLCGGTPSGRDGGSRWTYPGRRRAAGGKNISVTDRPETCRHSCSPEDDPSDFGDPLTFPLMPP